MKEIPADYEIFENLSIAATDTSLDNLEKLSFPRSAWERGLKISAYAFLNNQDQEIGGDIMEALEPYDMKPALWSKRTDFARELLLDKAIELSSYVELQGHETHVIPQKDSTKTSFGLTKFLNWELFT